MTLILIGASLKVWGLSQSLTTSLKESGLLNQAMVCSGAPHLPLSVTDRTSVSPPFTQPHHHWYGDLGIHRGWSHLTCCPSKLCCFGNNKLITCQSSSICSIFFFGFLTSIIVQAGDGDWKKMWEFKRNTKNKKECYL